MKTAADTVLDARHAADPAAPMVTHYDLDAGTRIEQSALSTGNWAAKIAGLLRDEVGIGVGDDVLLDLPAHWLTPGVLLGVWWAGARVHTPGSESTGAGGYDAPGAVITVADRIDSHPEADELLAMSTDPMGRGLAASGVELPLGVTDLVEACRIHPDDFRPSGGVPDCFGSSTLAVLAAEVPGERVVVDADSRGDIVRDCAGVLAAGGSLVLATTAGLGRDAVAAELDRIAETEKATARL